MKKDMPTQQVQIPKMVITATDRLIVLLAAHGFKDTEIAKHLDIGIGTIKKKVNHPGFISEIEKLQMKIYCEAPKKQFERVFPKALKVAESILEDPTAKPSTRLMAAQDFMDRVAGKATQKVEVEGSMVRALYEKLDERKKNGGDKPIDADYTDVTDMPASREEAKEHPLDDVDRFLMEDEKERSK